MADYWSNFCSRQESVNALIWDDPKFEMGKVGLKKLETSLYRTVRRVFRYREPFMGGRV